MGKTDEVVISIFKLILIFMSVEYLGGEGISVYRVIIFPLSCIGCLLINKVDNGRISTSIIVPLFIFLLWLSLSAAFSGENWLSGLFLLPLCYFVIKFLIQYSTLDLGYAQIFSTYSIPHIICYLVGFQMNPNSRRFTGLCLDANFCGLYLSIALIASLCLLAKLQKKKYKLLVMLNIVFTAFLIFSTGSRGSILSVLVLLLLGLIFSQKSIALKCIVVTLMVVGYSYLMIYVNSLPAWVSPDDSLIDSVLCRFQHDNLEDGGGRTEIWSYAFKAMFEGGYFIIPIGRETVMSGFTNGFLHNTFIELLVRTGIIPGLIMSISIFATCYKLLVNYKKKRIPDNLCVLSYVSVIVLMELFFISAIDFKMFWIAIFCSMSINKICQNYRNYLSNTVI